MIIRTKLHAPVVKPRFFWFSGKNIILCIFKGEMAFKMYRITFFSKISKKNMCAYPT